MTSIDESARVAAGAVIGADVTIGPFCVIGADVVIGDGCRLIASVHLTGHTTIGPRSVVYPFCSLGTPPQSTHYRGGPTRLVLGADCDLRESVTMNRGTEDGGAQTAIWIPPRSGRSARPPLTCSGMDVVPPASRVPASQKRHAPWPSAPSP